MTPEKRFAALVERVSGIVVGEQNLPKLRAIAHDRATANGFADLESYVDALGRAPEGAEWRRVLDRITVKESSLFRGPSQFEVLAQMIVPGRIVAGRRAIRIWSAGCARGEETATLAVTLAACPALAGRDWSILGTDIDEEALERARLGIFPRRSVRRVPPPLLSRFFEEQGDRYRLIEPLRKKIELRYLNLVNLPPSIPEGPFDVIFLRNVLIYFREDSQARVAASIAPHLAIGGFLFVGPSESLRQIAPHFEPRNLGTCFGYQTAVKTAQDGARAEAAPPRAGEAGCGRVSGAVSVIEIGDVISAHERGEAGVAQTLLASLPSDPEDPLRHAAAGFLAERSGRFDDAVRAYRAATYLDQSLFQVRFMMAQCLARFGWVGRARREFRALVGMLAKGEGTALPWADRIGLPGRAEVGRLCVEKLEEPLTGHHSTST